MEVQLRSIISGGCHLRTHWTMFPGPSKGSRGRLETGGCFQDHGSHYIDQYRWWVGEVDSVQGSLLIQWPEEMEVEDHGDEDFEQDDPIIRLCRVDGGRGFH